MVEYLRSVWLADLDFYSRALRVGCSVKCLPGYPTFLCQAMCLCWSFFQFSETCLRCWMLTWIWPPSTLLWNTLGLCMSITNCAAVVAFGDDVLSGFSQHESWQKYGRNYALVLGFFFWMWIFDLLCSTVAGYPGLDPCFQQWSCKYSCYNISHRGLSETFPFCKVTNFRCYTRIQVRNTNPKCRAVTW